ncbi:MAG: hypothetical protein IPO08_21535 [Xanthomonadales bacterium]|nr:hypothetical protein [Xanthomonadales bacterium]
MQSLFSATHEVEAAGMGGATCRCVRLPDAGSVGDQDAWLWEALGVMRDTSNTLLAERMAEASPRA